MKEISLSKGHVAIVDDEDFERLSKHKWYADVKTSDQIYAKTSRFLGADRKVYLHRLVAGATHRHEYVDHIDGNTLNNQKQNLRICTNAQNISNGKSHKGSISRFKGVTFCKEKRKWASAIGVNYKTIHLGRFENETDAALAYNEGAKKYHGEFARLNIV